MNWELFYLICFVVGFAFTALSFLSGTLHFHFHLPHGHFHGVGHAGHTPAHGQGGGFPFFNPMSIAVFLAWFGGTGYLLVHHRHVWVFAGLALASLAGFTGASLVFLFVAKFLMARDFTLNPDDFEMVGVLGRVSGVVRSDGVGEMIFEQQGVRKACAVRSDNGEEITLDEEVVVTRYDHGIAWVHRWQDFADKAGILPEGKQQERSL
jgi:hypothetical protein